MTNKLRNQERFARNQTNPKMKRVKSENRTLSGICNHVRRYFLITFFGYTVGVCWLCVGCKPAYVAETDQIANKAKIAIDPIELQKWAVSNIVLHKGYYELAPGELPDSIRYFDTNSPPNASVGPDE